MQILADIPYKMKCASKVILFNILVSTFVIPVCFADNIYRCQNENGVIYQDSPCSGRVNQEILDSNRYPPSIPTEIQSPEAKLPKVVAPSSAKPSMQKTGGEGQIIIERSSDSHFYIDGFINGVPIRFLVDTGASLVAIPDSLMLEMGLRNGEAVNVRSAAGIVKAYKTNINELRLGNYTFNNILAQTMSGNQALLGMNVLSEFDVTLKDDQLILSNKNN